MLQKGNARCGWRASSQRQTWVRDTLAKTVSCVLGEISAVLRTGASCNHNKTSHHIWLYLLWVCIGAIPLPMASVTIIFFYLYFEQGSSYAMSFPYNQVFWRMSPFLAGRFVQAELKSFTHRPGVFQSMTTWGCLGFRKCRSCRERARVTHSPSMHTGNFPGRSCRWCWPETPLGTAGTLAGLRLQTKPFVPLRTSLKCRLFFFPSFSFSTSGEQNQPSIYGWKWLFQTSCIPPTCCWKTKPVLVWSHKETAGDLFFIKSTRYCGWRE